MLQTAKLAQCQSTGQGVWVDPRVGDHLHNLGSDHAILQKRLACPFVPLPVLTVSPRQPRIHHHPHLDSFASSRSFYKWNQIVCGLLRLASSTQLTPIGAHIKSSVLSLLGGTHCTEITSLATCLPQLNRYIHPARQRGVLAWSQKQNEKVRHISKIFWSHNVWKYVMGIQFVPWNFVWVGSVF